MTFDLYLTKCVSFEQFQMFREAKSEGKKQIKSEEREALKRRELLESLSIRHQDYEKVFHSSPRAIKKDQYVTWCFDVKEKDPWMVSEFLFPPMFAEDAEPFLGYIHLSISSTSFRYVRNVTNALSFSVRFSKMIECNILVDDDLFKEICSSDGLLTPQVFSEHIVGGNLNFLTKQREMWRSKTDLMCVKNMAPLEFPVGNLDIVVEYFSFTLYNLPIPPQELLSTVVQQSLPPGLKSVQVSPNILRIVDRRNQLSKVQIQIVEDRVKFSPNYFSIPNNMYRSLSWTSVAGTTLTVVKAIMQHQKWDMSTICMFNNVPVNKMLMKKIQENCRNLGVEFYTWYKEYMT